VARHAPTQEDLTRVIHASGVRDERVIAAFRDVPRAAFVPEERSESAYVDEPIRIPHGQVTTQPSLVAKMVTALELGGSEKALEVGTGYGFQTALLAELARHVWSIERWPDLAETARANLEAHGTRNAEIVVGDGSEGLAEHAPFDAIVVAAAAPVMPNSLYEQLVARGRLVVPVGGPHGQRLEVIVRSPEGPAVTRSVPCRFVPLVGAEGF
jgi:protein-L-isoaspartate(D-aspartate) O-methyltransferase